MTLLFQMPSPPYTNGISIILICLCVQARIPLCLQDVYEIKLRLGADRGSVLAVDPTLTKFALADFDRGKKELSVSPNL